MCQDMKMLQRMDYTDLPSLANAVWVNRIEQQHQQHQQQAQHEQYLDTERILQTRSITKSNSIRKVLGIRPVVYRRNSTSYIGSGHHSSTTAATTMMTTEEQRDSNSSSTTNSPTTSQQAPKRVVLYDPMKMEQLLGMIRSDKFIGTVDPEYHACYFPKVEECKTNEDDNMDQSSASISTKMRHDSNHSTGTKATLPIKKKKNHKSSSQSHQAHRMFISKSC